MPAARNRCPHCEGYASVRSSTLITRIVRDVYLRCETLSCGWSGKAQVHYISTITESANPRPGIKLPRAAAQPPNLPKPANDPLPLAANDDEEPTEATG